MSDLENHENSSQSQPEGQSGIQPAALFAIILALLGIGVSLYSLMHHHAVMSSGVTDFSCNINQTFSCDTVAKSKYAELFGIPNGAWGIGYFISMIVIVFLGLRDRAQMRFYWQAYMVLTVMGVLSSLVFGFISLGIIGSVCLSCLAYYAVNFAQLAVVYTIRRDLAGFEIKPVFQVMFSGALGLILTLVVYTYVRPMPTGPMQEKAPHQADDGHGHDQVLSSTVVELPVSKSRYSGYGEDHRYGNEEAKVVLVEFADFQCPACKQMAESMRQIKQEFRNQILFVFKHYPLDQACNSNIRQKLHEYACNIAALARCAGDYGKFWEFHDMAFANQKDASTEEAIKWAQQVGLTKPQIDQCLSAESKFAKIQEDIRAGDKAGVKGTPALYLNGRAFYGERGVEQLRVEILKALGN